MHTLKTARATVMGFSPDKRRRRRQHRSAARHLLQQGDVFNRGSAPGSTFYGVALWHLAQARAVTRITNSAPGTAGRFL